MTNKIDNRELFESTGCLSSVAIRLFVDGALNEEQLTQVKEHADKCDFCKSALDGARLFSSGEAFSSRLNNMNDSRWRKSLDKKGKSQKLYAGLSTIAASLILLFGLHFVFTSNQVSEETLLQLSQIDEMPSLKHSNNLVVPVPKNKYNGNVNRLANNVMAERAMQPKAIKSLVVEERIVIADVEDEIIVEELEFNGFEHDVELDFINFDDEAKKDVLAHNQESKGSKEKDGFKFRINENWKMFGRKERAAEDRRNEQTYMVAEVTPMFEGGGSKEFNQYLANNLKVIIPDSVMVESIVVSFVVDASGNVNKVKLVSGTSSDELNKQIVKYIESSPVWVPGYFAGKPGQTLQESEIVLDSANRKNSQ